MEQNDRIVFVTMSGSESCTNFATYCLRFAPEISFEAPISSFIKEESGVDDATIHKLASYYSSTLKSLSE
ncbi:MAG: hypothetical protein VB016_05140 [Methanomassiliicoccaceae archaeon]|nr:hypothetical protein [Methanomassiliicoccaceae archaeon]